MKDIMLGQLEAQFKQAAAAGQMPPDLAKAQVAAIGQAFNDFVEGRPVDPTAVSAIPQIQQLIAMITNPATAKLSRDLFGFDPGGAVGKLRVPVFVFNGLKDAQVDPNLDAPDANHVLKHETKSTAELRKDLATTQANYNAPGAVLDPTTLSALGNWIALHDKE